MIRIQGYCCELDTSLFLNGSYYDSSFQYQFISPGIAVYFLQAIYEIVIHGIFFLDFNDQREQVKIFLKSSKFFFFLFLKFEKRGEARARGGANII